MTDIFSLSLEELAEKIKSGQLSSVEVCEKYIDRIKKFEKDVKAWAHFDKKVLLEKATEADEHRKAGKPTGSLHGVPIAVKDIIGTVDMPTECGTVIRKGKSYSQNAEIIDLLHASGAIVMGKTATSELAYLGPPATTNPHDKNRTPGGSSSGSAASVASFMAPASIGSQTGGSVIRPASYCGVVGYKPSYGLISRNGVLRTSFSLDQIGMFGRKVEDVAMLAKVLIKKDKYDAATIHYSTENILSETKKGPIFEPKFIFYKTDHWKIIDKKSRESFEYFIKSFKKNIEIFDTPSYFKDIHKYHQIIHETDLANNFSVYYKKFKKKLSKYMQDAISNGNKHTAKEYAEAIDFMKRSYESYEEVFEDYHGVLSPSSPGVAPKGLKSTGTAEFNKVWSYLGTPCISLPLLEGENNLPLGVQLIGNKYDDHRFLGVAKWLEKECQE
jgi:Asp-tRNA(Asn)/Glu-tRNA(Gln) amidotransferase A subunit family amidase